MGTTNLTIDEVKKFAELADEAYRDYKIGDKFPPDNKTYTVVDVLNDEETGAYAFLAEIST
ncbi:hypothetical protein [Persephonella sp.]